MSARLRPTAVPWIALALAIPLSVPAQDSPRGSADDTLTRADNARQLGERAAVIVTGTRRPVGLSVAPAFGYVVGPAALASQKPASVGEALAYVPGVTVENGTGVGLPFRASLTVDGAPPQDNLILVDGQRLLSEHAHTGIDVDLIPPDQVRRIEVLKGASSAQYGSEGMGGVVNIITKPPTASPDLEFRSFAGTAGLRHAGLAFTGPVSGAVRNALFNSWEQSDGLPITMPLARKDAFGYKRLDLLDKVQADPLPGLRTEASLRYFRSTTQFPANGAPVDDQSYLLTPSVSGDYAPDSAWDMHAGYYYSIWRADKSSELGELYAPDMDIRYRGWSRQVLLAGTEYNHRDFSRAKLNRHSQDLAAVYAQDDYTPVDPVTLQAALRLDRIDAQAPVPTPKLSVLVRPAPAWSVRASGGRGFRAPTVQERYEQGFSHGSPFFRYGNPELEPEYSWGATGNVDYTPIPWLGLGVGAYGNYLHNLITTAYWRDSLSTDAQGRSSVLQLWRRENVERAMTRGVEGDLRLGPFQGLSLAGGASVMDNRNLTERRPLPYYPGQTAFVRLDLSRRTGPLGYGGFLGCKYARDRRYANEDTQRQERLADYQDLEADAWISWRDRVRAYAAGSNLLGEHIELGDDNLLRMAGEPQFRLGVEADIR